MFRSETVTDARKKDNLEIEVMDYYTGKRRSVKTLSGGESFKAALCLEMCIRDRLVIVVGLAFLPINKSKIGAPLNFDLEFSGGTSSTITFDKSVKVDDSLEKKVVSAYEKVSKSTSVQGQKVKANNQMVIKLSLIHI